MSIDRALVYFGFENVSGFILGVMLVKFRFLVLFFASVLLGPSFGFGHGVLVLDFDPNVVPEGAEVHFFIYESEQSWEVDNPRDLAVLTKVEVGAGQIHFDLPPHQYSISAFIDLNQNREIDKNPIGMPKEKFALSNISSRLWSQPSWNDVKFEVVEGKEKHITLKFKFQ